jgi:hypothetical protein
MARWTQDPTEEQHITQTTKMLFDKGVFIEIIFTNGEKINCHILGASFENDYNGNNIHNLKYRAELKVVDEAGETHSFDLLDIADINRGKEFLA